MFGVNFIMCLITATNQINQLTRTHYNTAEVITKLFSLHAQL